MQYGLARSGLAANNVAVLTTATATADIDTSGAQLLTVVTRLKGTVVVADLTLNVVKPYYPDGVTLVAAALPAKSTTAVAVGGADVIGINVYDVTGIQKVQASAKNNNVGTLNLDIVFYVN